MRKPPLLANPEASPSWACWSRRGGLTSAPRPDAPQGGYTTGYGRGRRRSYNPAAPRPAAGGDDHTADNTIRGGDHQPPTMPSGTGDHQAADNTVGGGSPAPCSNATCFPGRGARSDAASRRGAGVLAAARGGQPVRAATRTSRCPAATGRVTRPLRCRRETSPRRSRRGPGNAGALLPDALLVKRQQSWPPAGEQASPHPAHLNAACFAATVSIALQPRSQWSPAPPALQLRH